VRLHFRGSPWSEGPPSKLHSPSLNPNTPPAHHSSHGALKAPSLPANPTVARKAHPDTPWSTLTQKQKSTLIESLVNQIPLPLRGALATSTHRRHAALLLQMQLYLESNPHHTVVQAVVHLIATATSSPAARRTMLGNVIGAIRYSALMGSSIPPQPRLQDDPAIKLLLRANTKKMHMAAGAVSIYAATPQEIKAALVVLERRRARLPQLYLHLWWTLCARSGDALELLGQHLVHRGKALSARFVTGKVVAVCGPVTTHTTALPVSHQAFIPHTGPLFAPALRSRIHATTMEVLKSVNPRIEVRSLRRGSLTAMALSGASVETLLSFSHHRSPDMLFRYLGWGMDLRIGMDRGSHAALSLLPKLPAANSDSLHSCPEPAHRHALDSPGQDSSLV
jgi:hypothetical protein